MEFHINREVRDAYQLRETLFSLTGNVVLADLRQVRELTERLNAKADPVNHPERFVRAGQLYAMGLIDEILHYITALYRQQIQPDVFDTALFRLDANLGAEKTALLLRVFSEQVPPQQVYAGKITVDAYLKSRDRGENCRALALEEMMLLALANLNPAFKPFTFLFDDQDLAAKTVYTGAIEELKSHLAALPVFGPDGMNLWDLLRAPALNSPDSLSGQLEYMRKHWGLLISRFMARLLMGLDVIKEEEKPVFGGPGPTEPYTYEGLDEYERFSQDQDWMPRTVLIAKSTLVWLYQLSQRYGRPINRLDEIPDEALDELARRGFTGLWLIGLWERSAASRTVKQWTGNPEAAASAYSLYDYDIAGELGGWGSLMNLRDRCARRGIRLGSDMVPNHTGIDSRWVMEHPDRFLRLRYPPFPSYTFNGGNLSGRDGIGIYIEDHYYTRSDAAVVFKRVDFNTGEVNYIYHGNDGTSMPWNDTAQIDFLNPEAREAVIRTIVGVCKQFSIVRFDAAMTLAKRHIRRLWYPEPGHGGDIASRSEHAISTEEFNRRIPNEFWREVVDRCAVEAPNTLLLAEAFWMMEGYFVRTLGMHRVYNSAFMNMLKNEENAKYRATIKNTLEFDPEILKRFVNFMNNPDEETAVAQFGKGDKYFGICTLLVTMPGLPMFGHGQIEGFEEKYGMEYRRAYQDEQPDQYLVDRHEREIFPLMKRRTLFSGSAGFRLYDFYADGVNENVFAYSNRRGDDRALVVYNNAYSQSAGWVHHSAVAIPQRDGISCQDTLAQALSLHAGDRYFTLLRERSGLWYIRSSKEITERGLFISLRGYESQVFLDIHEVEDTRGRWARLNHDLAGRGVRNLQTAVQDLFLKELYDPLMALFTAETMDGLYRVLAGNAEPDAAGKAEAFIASLREPVLDFVCIAAKYLDGAAGRWDPFDAGGEFSPVAPEQIWEVFARYLHRLIRLADYGAAAPAKPGKAGRPLAEVLGEQLRSKPAAVTFAAGYGFLTLLRPIIGGGTDGAAAAALMDLWSLDRKLREACGTLGISEDEACRVTAIMRAVLARTSPLKKEKSRPVGPPVISPLVLIIENYKAEDFRRILGVNLFEDCTWFNKEAFEEALFYVPLFLIPEDEGAFEEADSSPARKLAAGEVPIQAQADPGVQKKWRDRMDIIAGIVKQLSLAEAESGYRLDRLIEALSETRKKPSSARKGGAGKKSDNTPQI
ncbi:MAG: alpha-amylase [Spirochaetaceae bacterium]|nr:alpha-amylase [Spirochaetaceae bacterium]